MESGDLFRVSSARLSSSNVWRNSGLDVFSRSSFDDVDDEEALKWAAIEKLPTYLRITRGILTEDGGQPKEVDVKNLGLVERRNLVERLVKIAEEDNEKFLLKLKKRIERVGLDLPTIEVRFEHLNVDAEAYVGGRALPTIFNFSVNILEGFLNYLHILPNRKKPLPILHDVSGIIKPARALFMDEISTGLDSSTTFQIVNSIRQSIHILQGTTVVSLLQPAPETYDSFISVREFAEAFQSFHIGRKLGDELAVPYDKIKSHPAASPGSKDLYFPTQYSQSFFTQCMACLWKQHWSYWRNPPYTAVRLLFTTFIALMFGTIFCIFRGRTQDIFNAMGSMYAAVLFIGVQNATSVQPVVAIERTVFYRERAAGMYSALPYAFGQVLLHM